MRNYVSIFALLVVTAVTAIALSLPADVPAAGTVAPTFKLTTNEGKEASLSDFKGKWVAPSKLITSNVTWRSMKLPTR